MKKSFIIALSLLTVGIQPFSIAKEEKIQESKQKKALKKKKTPKTEEERQKIKKERRERRAGAMDITWLVLKIIGMVIVCLMVIAGGGGVFLAGL